MWREALPRDTCAERMQRDNRRFVRQGWGPQDATETCREERIATLCTARREGARKRGVKGVRHAQRSKGRGTSRGHWTRGTHRGEK